MKKSKQNCLNTDVFHCIMKDRKMGKLRTGIRNFCVLVFAVVSLCHASATETQTVFDKIIQNVVNQQLSTARHRL